MKREETNLYRELFEMVYQWGRVGIITDEHCPAFLDLITKIENEACNDRERHGTT
jgi:hypothetical protein